jgi:Glyoxalase/Bleomycin resistance protein/Dioxygenase superfamily
MSPMEHPMFEQPWPEGEYRFFQIGFVVDDLLAAAADWARVFGVGPFHVMPVFDQHVIYRGSESTITCQVAVAQAGPVQIELIQQHCDRPSVFREWSRDGTCAFHGDDLILDLHVGGDDEAPAPRLVLDRRGRLLQVPERTGGDRHVGPVAGK